MVDYVQETSETHSPNEENKNIVTYPMETATRCTPTNQPRSQM